MKQNFYIDTINKKLTNLPGIVYHYCSPKTFFSIIKNKELWLSPTHMMNDTLETRLVHSYLEEFWNKNSIYLMQFWEKEKEKEKQKTVEDQDNNKHLAAKNLEEFIKYYGTFESSTFLTCFTELEDSLSQWRAYANQGTGFVIGFDTETLMKSTGESCHFANVIYNKKTYEKLIETLIDKIVYDNADYSWYKFAITALACILKNEGFEEEKETRMIISRTKPLTREKGILPYEFIDTPTGICPILKLKLPEKAIGCIGLGPLNETTKEDLESFLKDKKFNNHITIYNAKASSFRNRN